MNYKFCKINLFGKTTSWVLEISDYNTYKEWSDKYHGADNIKERKQTWDERKILHEKEYPKEKYYPTNDDIRIIRWPNGKHFYAKIGLIEVVDEDGNNRWNTGRWAYEEAQKFLKKLQQ